jgi:hypothetical protein
MGSFPTPVGIFEVLKSRVQGFGSFFDWTKKGVESI